MNSPLNMSTGVLGNGILLAAVTAWCIAQIVKVPLHYMSTREWDWTLLLRAGGMPSSHSALVAGVAHGIGLSQGFASPLFALAAVLAMIVIYDATGIRRQAGRHAAIINQFITDLASGHPLKQEELREVLGHTPLEALAGTILGIGTAQVFWYLWT